LPVGEIIPGRPGRPKISRHVCDCGSADLRRAGWHFDGRQHVRCNKCGKEFALFPGTLAPAKLRDTLGRPIHHKAAAERDWWLPDPVEEASACFVAARFENCDFASMRRLINVTDVERSQLYFLISKGVLWKEQVEKTLEFRAAVLRAYDKLVASYNKNRLSGDPQWPFASSIA
jgi:hypothetical protein